MRKIVTDPKILAQLNGTGPGAGPVVKSASPGSAVTDPGILAQLNGPNPEQMKSRVFSAVKYTSDFNADAEADVESVAKETGLKQKQIREKLAYYKTLASASKLDPVKNPVTASFLAENAGLSRDDIESLGGIENIAANHPDLTPARIVRSSWESMKQNISSKLSSGLASLETLDLEGHDVIDNFEAGLPSLTEKLLDLKPKDGPSVSELERFDLLNTGNPKRDEYDKLVLENIKALSETGVPFVIEGETPESLAKKEAIRTITEDEIAGIKDKISYLEPGKDYNRNSSGFIEDVFSAVSGSLIDMGAAAFGPIVGTAAAASTIHGAKYAELTRRGIPPQQANEAARISAMYQAPVEYLGNALGLKFFGKAFKAKSIGNFLATMVKSSATEGVEEYIQQFPDAYADIIADNPTNSTKENLGILYESLGDIAVKALYPALVGAGSGFLMTGSGKVANIPGVISEGIRYKQAAEDGKKFNRSLNNAVWGSKTQNRSPEHVKRFLNGLGLNENVFLPPEAVQGLFQSDTPEAKSIVNKLELDLPVVKDQVNRGAQIEVPLADVHTKLTQQEFSAIESDIAMRLGEKTSNEVEALDLEKELEDAADILRVEEVFSKQFIDDEVTRIKSELVGVGYSSKDADNVLALLNRFTYTKDSRAELLQKIKITKADPRAQYVGRDALPEFQRGFLQKVFKRKEEGLPKGHLRVTDSEYIISLFDRADRSTVVHELGHVFLEEMSGLVGSKHATNRHVNDFGVIKDWLGAKGDTFSTEQHEKFAKGFETYLVEGVAPTADLKSAFEAFKNWLLAVYQSANQLNVDMSDDVRRVFDRMFSAKADVFQAMQDNDMVMPTKEQLDAGGFTPETRGFMDKLLVEAQEKAEKDLAVDRNRNIRKSIAAWRIQAELDVDADPVYQVMDYLQKNEGLDIDMVTGDFGVVIAEELRKKRIAKLGGSDAEVVAANYGFDSSSEMVKKLLTAVSRGQRIKAIINERTKQHDRSYQAEEYVANTKAYAEFLELKHNQLAVMNGRPAGSATPTKIVTDTAKRDLGEMQVTTRGGTGATNQTQFLKTMQKFQKIEKSKTELGKFAEAANASIVSRLNYEYARESKNVKEDVEGILKLSKRLAKRDPAKFNPAYRDSILDVLHRFGLARGRKPMADEAKANENLRKLVLGSIEGAIDPFSIEDNLLSDKKSFKELKVKDLRTIGNLLKYLDAHGVADAEQVIWNGEKVDAVDAKMAAESVDLKPKPIYNKGTFFDWFSRKSRPFWAYFDGMDLTVSTMGGFKDLEKGGGFSYGEEIVLQSIVTQTDKEHKFLEKHFEKIRAPHKRLLDTKIALEKKFGNHIVENVPEVPDILKLDGQNGWWSPTQILALAMHTGNDSNKSRIFTGFEKLSENGKSMTESDLEQLLAFLTKEDWDAIQAIWDINEEIFTDINKVHTRLNGFASTAIEPVAFTRFGKEFKGGYASIRYNLELAKKTGDISKNAINELHEVDVLQRQEARFQVPTAKSGFTKGRAEKTPYALDLTLDSISGHITDSAKYIYQAETVRDIDRVFRRGQYAKRVVEVLGPEVHERLRPLLANVVNPHTQTSDHLMRRLVAKAVGVTVVFHLATNAAVMMKQFGSSFAAGLRIGKWNWLKSYGIQLMHPSNVLKNYEFMMSESEFMPQRQRSMRKKFNKNFKLLEDKKGLIVGKVPKHFTWKDGEILTWDDVVSVGFLGIRSIDLATVMPLWHGAYNQKMEELGRGNVDSHSQAIKYADSLIRETQPDQHPLSKTPAQLKGDTWALLTMFSSFTMGVYQKRVRKFIRARRSGKITNMEYMEHFFLEQVVPALFIQVAVAGIRGHDFDDEETYLEMAKGAVAQMVTMPIPIIGNTLYPFNTYGVDLTPIVGMVEAVIKPLRLAGKAAAEGDPELAAKAIASTGASALILAKFPGAKHIAKAINKK